MISALTDTELDYLLNFVGYGRLDANVWFIGMEEAGGGEDNIRKRLLFQQVEDCAEAHKILGITKHHWGKRIIQPTWWGMCYVMLRLEGKAADRESIRKTQADSLGRFNGSTLLCELMPIPKPSIGGWGYEDLIPQFESRKDYYQVVKPMRIEFLKNLIDEKRPEVVVCYGKKYWNDFQELFGGMRFQLRNPFKVSKGNGMGILFINWLVSVAQRVKYMPS